MSNSKIQSQVEFSDDPNFIEQRSRTSLLGWCAAFLLLCLGFLLNDDAQAMDPEQAQAGSLLLRESSGTYRSSLYLSGNAEVEISGMIAQVSMTQSFQNDSSDWAEAVYVFPLPEDAAVYAMEIHIAERVIIGSVKEKEQARREYNAAKKSGRVAALTEQERPNIFTQNIANIPPNETIEVTIKYQQNLSYKMGMFSWRLPMTLTPRYIPGTSEFNKQLEMELVNGQYDLAEEGASYASTSSGWAKPTNIVPDAHRVTPPMQAASDEAQRLMSISIKLDSGIALSQIRAPYHDLVMNKNNNIHSIGLKDGAVAMDRDFVLEWAPANDLAPAAAAFTETIDGEHYATVMLLPPVINNSSQHFTRDIIYVIDTSGSMAGTSLEQAKKSLTLALSRLKPQDRFNVIEFNSSYQRLFSNLHVATQTNVSQAHNWVQNLSSRGGTEMLSALNSAINGFENDGRLQQLVFITDGAVGNETQLFERIHSGLGETRLFTVGIGSAPNSYFMKKSAEFGRGTHTYIGNNSEISKKMIELFIKLESAVATNISVDWNGSAEHYPSTVGDLYSGEPVYVTARLDELDKAIEISGTTNAQPWMQKILLNPNENSNGVARTWARSKIESLQDSLVRGADTESVKQDVLALSLQHQILSPYSSFVAVEEKISNPNPEAIKSETIKNLMPKGSVKSVPFANTATPSRLYLYLGCCLFMLFSIINFRALREPK